MSHEHEAEDALLEAEVARWRAALGARHFSDDGRTLRGSIEWNGPAGPATALVEVEPGESFPFAPPAVRVLDPGTDAELTFHLDAPAGGREHGNLCLWDDEYTLDIAPWRDADALITRVRTWLEETAIGWPDDDTCDLERYLSKDARMILYDGETLKALRATCVRVTGKATPIVTITTEQGLQRRRRGRRVPARKDRKLCWIGDLGQVDRPFRNWADLRTALGEHGRDVERKIRLGIVQFLLLEYRRGGNSAVLALVVRLVPGTTGLNVAAAEAADISRTSRMLRGGPAGLALAERSVAIVGVGAVGSYVADLLFRSGIRKLTVIDFERMRPGNIVRHLTDDLTVGMHKVHAVRSRLALRGLDASQISPVIRRISTPDQAYQIFQKHDVVVDATGSDRTTSLLTWMSTATDTPLVSVCLQRQGALARVDRYPLRSGETHLPAVHDTDSGRSMLREPGCGQPVSPTPPSAVVCAAELATRVVLDELEDVPSLPSTLVDVRIPQDEPPYDRLGLATSRSQDAA
ncbi:HesA/MoeB/ThiF family protein [Actinophytocola sediminis]